MKLWTDRRWSLLAVGVVVAAAVGGIAYASIPDTGGVIHGCYVKTSGDLRVIDSGGKGCDPGERPLNWSQAGAAGPTGLTGATGPQGPGATSGRSTVANTLTGFILALGNGVKLWGACAGISPWGPIIVFTGDDVGHETVDVFGLFSDTGVFHNVNGENFGEVRIGDRNTSVGDFTGIVSRHGGGNFVQVIVHSVALGSLASPNGCAFSWMVTPSS
jgi:hypothetical protein